MSDPRQPSRATRAASKSADPYQAVTTVYDGPPPVDGDPSEFAAITKEYSRPPAGTHPDHADEDPPYQPKTALYGPLQPSVPHEESLTRVITDTQPHGTPAAPAATAPKSTSESNPEDPLAGTPYRTITKLGAGGMGEVYEAEDLEVGGRVVVKVLRDLGPLPDNQPSFAERMEREAQALARLHHPNIVQVSRYSRTPAGRPYLAMERLYGRTLKEELRSTGARSPAVAIDLVRQMLHGLAAAHDLGVVHRDIKLDNLFLCDPVDGHRVLKILDFGLTRWTENGPGAASAGYPTAHDVFVGTPRYAAPEQLTGTVDARTDIYSAGLVLFALLSGREPFHEVRGMGELLRAHQARDLDLRFAEALPPHLERALRRAIAKDPEDRFSTAEEFIHALETDAAETPPPSMDGMSVSTMLRAGATAEAIRDLTSPTPVPVRRRRHAVFLFAVAVVSAALFAAASTALVRWLTR